MSVDVQRGHSNGAPRQSRVRLSTLGSAGEDFESMALNGINRKSLGRHLKVEEIGEDVDNESQYSFASELVSEPGSPRQLTNMRQRGNTIFTHFEEFEDLECALELSDPKVTECRLAAVVSELSPEAKATLEAQSFLDEAAPSLQADMEELYAINGELEDLIVQLGAEAETVVREFTNIDMNRDLLSRWNKVEAELDESFEEVAEEVDVRMGEWTDLDATIMASIAINTMCDFTQEHSSEPMRLPWQLTRLNQVPSTVSKTVRYSGMGIFPQIFKKPGAKL